jgi:hypothetical protein
MAKLCWRSRRTGATGAGSYLILGLARENLLCARSEHGADFTYWIQHQ